MIADENPAFAELCGHAAGLVCQRAGAYPACPYDPCEGLAAAWRRGFRGAVSRETKAAKAARNQPLGAGVRPGRFIWCAAELMKLEQAAGNGVSMAGIAAVLDRTPLACKQRLHRLRKDRARLGL